MKPFHPVFSSPKLKKEEVYARLYPKQPFDLNKMRKLMSAFTTLVENFLVVLEGEHEAYRDNILLAKAYNRHNLSTNFEKDTRALIQVLQDSSKYSPTHHHILSQLNQDLFSLAWCSPPPLTSVFSSPTLNAPPPRVCLPDLRYGTGLTKRNFRAWLSVIRN